MWLQQVAQGNKFRDKSLCMHWWIFVQFLSLQQNVVAATSCTNSIWIDFVRLARLLCALYHQNALLKILQRFTGNQRVTLVTPGNLRLICLTQNYLSVTKYCTLLRCLLPYLAKVINHIELNYTKLNWFVFDIVVHYTSQCTNLHLSLPL